MFEIATQLDLSILKHVYQYITTGYEFRLVLNFIFCLIAGVIIGLDREKKGKAAGVSTHSLVACGAMLFTFISGMGDGDPTRIAAQVVSGIGFLGAGIIMKREGTTRKVSNLTTAASIWFTAAIGMVIGFQLYTLAIISIIFTYIIFKCLPHHNDGDKS